MRKNHFIETWKEKIINWKDKVVRRLQANPLLWIASAMLVVSGCSFIGLGIYKSLDEHKQSAPLMLVKEGTIKNASDWMKEDKLKSITSHTVFKKDSWMNLETLSIQIFESKSGETFRIDADALPEEFWKRVTESAEKQDFVISTGETFPKESRMMGIAALMFFYSALIMVLLFAQTMISQVVSGHTFSADARDRKINLEDIIGYDDVKREVSEIMEKVSNPARFARLGMRPPHGLLLLGDPGVGKTMFAKAMANEMGDEFFYCTGADFAEMYVGVGPRRVRTLFKRARKAGRAVIFIDEIDAIGARNTMGNDSERQGVINQFLAEMDGVNQNHGILVVGATNHPDLLDPALRRPGRFDKEIHIPLPDLSTREGILKHYLRDSKLDDTVDLQALARRTQGYSGAMLAGLVEETKNLAMREHEHDSVISQKLLETAQEIKILGIGTTKADPLDLDRVVVHELGHALCAMLHHPEVYVEKVTVSGRGRALGYCSMRPVRDTLLRTKSALEGDLMTKLAGRAAEEVILGDVSSGAADDLIRASELAREMVTRMGMGATTGLMVPPQSMDPGQMPDSVRADVQQILADMYARAKETVEHHRAWFEMHRQQLLTEETLEHDMLQNGLLK